MALRQMPNGAYVDVPNDITPQGMQSLMARFKAPAGTSAPSASPRVSQRDAEDAVYVDKTVKDLKKGQSDDPIMSHVSRAADSLAHAGSFGADDVLGAGIDAATSGAVEAFKKRDIGEIGRRYSNNRKAQKQYRSELSNEHPVDDLLGTVVGIVKNPIGAKTGVGKLATTAAKYSPTAAKGLSALKASRAARLAAKVGGSTVGVGARAGFNQGVATAAMDGKSPEDIVNEGGQNALYGAAAGVLLKGAGGAYNIIKNRSPASADRVAHERIAKILQGSEDAVTGKPFTPDTIENEIRATAKGGGQANVGDLMPETQGIMSNLVRRGVSGASRVANNAEDRALSAADRFDAKVRQVLKIDPKAPDAYEHGKALTATRKAAGKRDYSDAVMGKQLAWSDELNDVFKNPAIADALPGAEKLARIRKQDVSQLTLHPDFGYNPEAPAFVNKPSMHVMQNLTQSLDDMVSNNIRSNPKLAAAYSGVNRELKDAIAKVNPELRAANVFQRDMFEQSQSTELGQAIISKLTSKSPNAARELMDMVKAAGTHTDDLKIGFADALMQLRKSGNGDPVVLMRRVMRSPDQRAVLAHMFGSNKNLNEFEMFMRRETRAARTDKLIRSGHSTPNVTPDTNDGADALVDAGLGIARGGVFGPLSAASALSRAGKEAKRLSKSISPAAQAELLKILESDGKGLKSGIERSKNYKAIQERRMRKAAIAAGKLPQAVVGGYSEQ